MPRELKTVASNLTFSLISGSLIDLKVSSNDVKHITRVDCLYVQPSKVCFKLGVLYYQVCNRRAGSIKGSGWIFFS